jgi:hypothetical protein
MNHYHIIEINKRHSRSDEYECREVSAEAWALLGEALDAVRDANPGCTIVEVAEKDRPTLHSMPHNSPKYVYLYTDRDGYENYFGVAEHDEH